MRSWVVPKDVAGSDSNDVDVPAIPHHDFIRGSRNSHLSDIDEAPHVTTRKAKDPPSPLQLAREPRPARLIVNIPSTRKQEAIRKRLGL
jgi:hypothetical protein